MTLTHDDFAFNLEPDWDIYHTWYDDKLITIAVRLTGEPEMVEVGLCQAGHLTYEEAKEEMERGPRIDG